MLSFNSQISHLTFFSNPRRYTSLPSPCFQFLLDPQHSCTFFAWLLLPPGLHVCPWHLFHPQWSNSLQSWHDSSTPFPLHCPNPAVSPHIASLWRAISQDLPKTSFPWHTSNSRPPAMATPILDVVILLRLFSQHHAPSCFCSSHPLMTTSSIPSDNTLCPRSPHGMADRSCFCSHAFPYSLWSSLIPDLAPGLTLTLPCACALEGILLLKEI